MKLKIPKLSLVVLIGSSGSGKSTFARQHFLPTEIVSSDTCRGLVSDDENNQAASRDAFDLLEYIVAKRLSRGLLTVVDATNVQQEARKPLVALARRYHCLPVAIVLRPPEKVCHERNSLRADRQFGPHVVRNQRSQLQRSLRHLKKDGFRTVHVLDSIEDIAAATIEREPLWNDKREITGPFDIIGDIHGCYDELVTLFHTLGYEEKPPVEGMPFQQPWLAHPERTAVFVGDLCDRGPNTVGVYQLAINMVHAGAAYCVPGNHDMKLLRKLNGKNPNITHGLAATLEQIEALPEQEREHFCQVLRPFLEGLVSHYVFDQDKLVVAHAGMKEEYQGRGSGVVREFALYGATTGEVDSYGLPVREKWATSYRGSALVVYGHTPVAEPEWLNNTVNIDTGCVFGGQLTALRYPEQETVSVPALQKYCEPGRPFLISEEASGLSEQQLQDDILDAEDVLGKRLIMTRFDRNITIREENATAALEVMSRFAANPKWLIYLPPTMSPCATSSEQGLLEHPAEAFEYYRSQGVPRVICEEKHMGSRAVVIVCRNEETAQTRFGILEAETGIVYTRTGRRFFNDAELESQLLDRFRSALTATGFWDEFQTDWGCFDAELMPWSAKAQELLRSQYAAVGSAGRASLPAAVTAIEQYAQRITSGDASTDHPAILQRFQRRSQSLEQFVEAYRRYCWPVDSLNGLKLAPFHLLATEGKVHTNQNHQWHMETLARICQHDPELLLATEHRLIDLTDMNSVTDGIQWWQELTQRGGEGMVVKPFDWIVKGKKGLVQPAVKCRGKEYLRIIYSPDYDAPENLPRLRARNLGRKQSLATREFSLGLEGLERFVRKEPLRRVHECVFGVLALESEPVDPRL